MDVDEQDRKEDIEIKANATTKPENEITKPDVVQKEIKEEEFFSGYYVEPVIN
jgi:hypothetical protein